MMRRGIGWVVALVALLVALLVRVGLAQVATPGSRLAWDQDAPSLAEAQGQTYEASWDGAVAVPLTGVTCTGTASPYACSGALPPLTVGTHTVTLRARNATGTGPTSDALAFSYSPFALPSAPRNLRIFLTPGA